MIVKSRWTGTALAVAAALSLAAGLSPAQAATASTWRIAAVYGGPGGSPNLQQIVASGQDNAWAAGTSGSLSLMLVQWNGTSWQSVQPPARFVDSTSANSTALGTSSSDNTWVFPQTGQTTSVQYALGWNGSAWATYKLSSKNSVQATAVFSSSNVWAFGSQPNPLGFHGIGAAWVLRWDGTSWRRVPVAPGTPAIVSAVSPSDIWAVGPTAATASGATQTMIGMHWNGAAWTSLSLPAYPPVNGHSWLPNAMVATGPRDVWVEDAVSGGGGGGASPAGVIVSHWNGSTWTTVIKSLKRRCAGLTPDGHGGFWLQSNNPSAHSNSILDFHHGIWTSEPAPTEAGFRGSARDVTVIPGTASFWALGLLDPKGQGSSETDILQYGT